MRKASLVQALIIASFATVVAEAGAQNATPRELPPGAPPGTSGQNGTPAGVAPYGTPPGMDNSGRGSTVTAPFNTSNRDVRAYMDARQACLSRPASQQAACNQEVNSYFGSINPKCQKLNGDALADCLHGADHGS